MSVRLPLVLAASAILAQGCAAQLVQDDWHDHPSHPPLPAMHIEVAAKDLARVCGNHPGQRLHGCAIRVVDARVCLIYTPPQPAAWLMEHERKHCAGWDHGPANAAQTRVAAAFPS